MKKEEAIEYLEHIIESWTNWHNHHLKLIRALETLLEEVKKK